MNGLDLNAAIDSKSEIHHASKPKKWLDEYGDYLYHYAIQKLRNPTQAEDVVQETLLSALIAVQNNNAYTGKASEKTWLTGILNHKIIDLIRKEIRESTTEDIISLSDSNKENDIDNLFDSRGKWINPPQTWGNPEQLLTDRQFIKTLDHCLSTLSHTMSHIFTLKEILGKNTTEICKELGITTTNYSVILYRARMKLRECIEHIWSNKKINN